jgi:hypothetical protein
MTQSALHRVLDATFKMKFSFSFRWKHEDGSVVEFTDMGWTSDDPQKTDWLMKMNSLCSSTPSIAPGIRAWLDRHCELISFRGHAEAPEDSV